MWKRTIGVVGVAVTAAGVAACGTGEDYSRPGEVVPVGQATRTLTKTEALERASELLNDRVVEGDADGAWEYYSKRCQDIIGGVEIYKMMLNVKYAERKPHIADRTVEVDGSSGQVVSMDTDPSAPAWSVKPRTWTYIDDRWQFDNC